MLFLFCKNSFGYLTFNSIVTSLVSFSYLRHWVSFHFNVLSMNATIQLQSSIHINITNISNCWIFEWNSFESYSENYLELAVVNMEKLLGGFKAVKILRYKWLFDGCFGESMKASNETIFDQIKNHQKPNQTSCYVARLDKSLIDNWKIYTFI